MAQFKYVAQDSTGKKVKGVLFASDESELQMKLKEKDLFLLSVGEVSGKKRKGQLKIQTLADFARQMGTLSQAGVSLVRALNIIANEESIKPKERQVYEDLLRQIRQGTSLSEAMENQNGAFPPLMIYMFRSAESSGNLDEVALKMAELYEKEHKLKGKISMSLVYPKFLGGMIVAAILVITNFVLPQMQGLLGEAGTLPPATRALFGISDFMKTYWYIVLAVVLGIWLGWKWLMTIPSCRKEWHKVQLHMPVFGKLQKTICTSRFARTLSSLYSAGIPIVTALQIARKTIGNDYMDEQMGEVITTVRAGNSLSEALGSVDGVSRKLPDAVMVGEETGSLDSMLSSISETMEYDADIAISKMVSYVEPIMLIIMGIIVAFVLVAVFGAIYGSYDALGSVA